MDNKKYVAVYIRLACENNSACEMQEESVVRYAVENGYGDYNNITVYTDNGANGLNFNRPGFAEMMSDINNRRINTVIVKSIDRISRNYMDLDAWINDMERNGIVFKTVDGSYGDDIFSLHKEIRRFAAADYKRKRRAAHVKPARKPSKVPRKGDRGCV